jgi:peptidoglycan/LPS O-acetylase OafA/YrhL
LTGGKGLLAAAGYQQWTWTYFVLLATFTISVTIPISVLTYRYIEVPGMDMGRSVVASLRRRNAASSALV